MIKPLVRGSFPFTRPIFSQGLFSFERVLDRVFEAADGILYFAFYLVGLALRLQFGVTDGLADYLFDFAFNFFRRSGDVNERREP